MCPLSPAHTHTCPTWPLSVVSRVFVPHARQAALEGWKEARAPKAMSALLDWVHARTLVLSQTATVPEAVVATGWSLLADAALQALWEGKLVQRLDTVANSMWTTLKVDALWCTEDVNLVSMMRVDAAQVMPMFKALPRTMAALRALPSPAPGWACDLAAELITRLVGPGLMKLSPQLLHALNKDQNAKLAEALVGVPASLGAATALAALGDIVREATGTVALVSSYETVAMLQALSTVGVAGWRAWLAAALGALPSGSPQGPVVQRLTHTMDAAVALSERLPQAQVSTTLLRTIRNELAAAIEALVADALGTWSEEPWAALLATWTEGFTSAEVAAAAVSRVAVPLLATLSVAADVQTHETVRLANTVALLDALEPLFVRGAPAASSTSADRRTVAVGEMPLVPVLYGVDLARPAHRAFHPPKRRVLARALAQAAGLPDPDDSHAYEDEDETDGDDDDEEEEEEEDDLQASVARKRSPGEHALAKLPVRCPSWRAGLCGAG
jgi:hypothetical protein